MNHGGSHTGHGGGMDHTSPSKCSMNMLWNSQVENVCVVFESWHIQSWWGMVISCLVIAMLSFLYLHLLHLMQMRDKTTAIQIYLGQKPEIGRSVSTPLAASSSSAAATEESFLATMRAEGSVQGVRGGNLGIQKLPSSVRLSRALLYSLTMALSFFLMLVAMTYNTYLFASIIVGGFLGHWTYEKAMDVGAILNGQQAKGVACH